MITRPYPFQHADIKELHRRFDGRGLLAWEQGLGKTYGAYRYIWKYLPDDPPGPVVVACPAVAKRVWEREAKIHLGLRVEVLNHQQRPPGLRPPRDPNQIFVINYDILDPPRRDGERRPMHRSWANWLAELNPRLVIADEAQYIKNVRSGRTRAFRRMAREVPRLLFLTGTPITNSPLDLWALFNTLRPEVFPSRFAFACEYTHARKRPWGWEFKGGRNLDVLHKLLCDNGMLRRRKEDVLKDLPARTDTVVELDFERAEYDEAESNFLGWLGRHDGAAAQRAAKAEALTRMGYLKRLAGRLKIRPVIRWVTDFLDGSEGKLLLGALHRRVTGPLMERFGRSAVLVDGRLDERAKTAAFVRFNHRPDCRLLVGNLQAAGVAWSCTATSHAAVCEFPWRPDELAQFVARMHGIGRGQVGVPVQVWYLVAPDTIEADLCQVLQVKQSHADQALDGAPRGVTLDIYDQVKALMKARRRRRELER